MGDAFNLDPPATAEPKSRLSCRSKNANITWFCDHSGMTCRVPANSQSL
jgi:hypothetical protein